MPLSGALGVLLGSGYWMTKNMLHLASLFSMAIVSLCQQVGSALFAAVIFVRQAISLLGDL